jgi:Raf kinase inhibitor-like YbhB/YbcL family protein
MNIIKITSTVFEEGQRIPKKYTGEGLDISPPLSWSGVPEDAKELMIICDDPDAPTPEPWVHWVIYKIPASVASLKEDVPKKTRLTDPPGTLQGRNSWPEKQMHIGYRGPMPPPGHGTHRYYFKIYALEAKLAVEAGMDKKSLLKEIEDHVIAEGQLMGTYSR